MQYYNVWQEPKGATRDGRGCGGRGTAASIMKSGFATPFAFAFFAHKLNEMLRLLRLFPLLFPDAHGPRVCQREEKWDGARAHRSGEKICLTFMQIALWICDIFALTASAFPAPCCQYFISILLVFWLALCSYCKPICQRDLSSLFSGALSPSLSLSLPFISLPRLSSEAGAINGSGPVDGSVKRSCDFWLASSPGAAFAASYANRWRRRKKPKRFCSGCRFLVARRIDL